MKNASIKLSGATTAEEDGCTQAEFFIPTADLLVVLQVASFQMKLKQHKCITGLGTLDVRGAFLMVVSLAMQKPAQFQLILGNGETLK